ncbi:glycosyltransferase family 4 protein [filamentous cyanobacterium LEGE 11480]|uniref:Glycosyltransferase family 4 protein n=2 Tax=Romeriopsis TaxID=2992131 RepID=A0A928VU53_9CYAN|nr:glycosyltransferase family 4 protein [Romeriopsis navalis LEGE 11480]
MNRTAWVFLEIFSCEGGIQSYVRDILQTVANSGVPADVFLLRDGADVENPLESTALDFHYCKQATATLGRLRLAASLFKNLLKYRPDRVYCGHVLLAPLVRAMCKPFGIPYTVLTYGKEVWETLPASKRSALQDADRIWTISRYSRDRLCQANQVASKKVDFLYCAVDGQRFQPRGKSAELVEQYGLADSKVLMTVARLWSGDPYKGVDVTIRALPQILASHPQVKYLVVGRGDDQPRLAALAADLGVSEQVVFAGFVATEDLVAHYNLADAYIMPSQEGFGIVYLEAMACGKPVLSGDDDGSADPLQDGRLGWRVPHRDPEQVAIACQAILGGSDPRCNPRWLREQSLMLFDKLAFSRRVMQLVA